MPTSPDQHQSKGLIATEPLRDLGVLPQGAEARAEFELTNRYRVPVTIAHIMKNCDCVGTDLAESTLDPGESTTLIVNWETGKKRGKVSSDIVVNHATQSGFGSFEQTRLRIAAVIQPDYSCDPEVASFDGSRDGEEVIRFEARRLEEFRLLDAYCNNSAFTVSEQTEDFVRIRFDHSAWREHGRSDGRAALVAVTNSRAEPEFTVRLNVSNPDDGGG